MMCLKLSVRAGGDAVYRAEPADHGRDHGPGAVFNRTAGIPISAFVSVFNITMFLLGAWVLGKQFAVTTVLSTLVYPLLLGVLEGPAWRAL